MWGPPTGLGIQQHEQQSSHHLCALLAAAASLFMLYVRPILQVSFSLHVGPCSSNISQ